MNNLLNNFFDKNNLEYKNKTFVIAVSTGVDSSVLFNLFLEFQKRFSNIKIICAHVNHHRREQSEIEEKYIKEYCDDNNIKLYVKELYFDKTENFQAIARKARYEFFDEVMKKENGDYLVLAHHGDDNVETVLMRLIRGSSLAGYGGIKEINIGNNYLIIRPLLSISKTDIINYQKLHTIKYYEDESNSHLDYTRNRLRHIIIPNLKNECSDLIEKILEFSNTIENASIIVNEKRDFFIKNNILKANDKIIINRLEYLNLSEYLKQEVLFELVKKDSLSKANIEELIKIIKSDKQNYICYFKNIFDFIIEYDKIIIDYNHIIENNEDIYLLINELGKYVVNDKLTINVIKKDNNYLTNKNDVWYNSNNLPVIIRNKKTGDKIKLENGFKKVSDLLIDLKITQAKRKEILIMENSNQEILSVIGVRKSIVLKKSSDCDIVIRFENKEGEN